MATLRMTESCKSQTAPLPGRHVIFSVRGAVLRIIRPVCLRASSCGTVAWPQTDDLMFLARIVQACPGGGEMYSAHAFQLPVCCVCAQSVALESSKTDERGRAIHEECYLFKLRLIDAISTQRKPPQSVGRARKQRRTPDDRTEQFLYTIYRAGGKMLPDSSERVTG
jgi:hypothetical protein